MQNISGVKQFEKIRTLYSNQCVWKMAKKFDLQDDTELAYEVQKYKCIQDKEEAVTRVVL